MLALNVKDETSKLRAVVLGTAVSNGPTPTAEEAYDPKSLEHILAGTYPEEADHLQQIHDDLADALEKCGIRELNMHVIQQKHNLTHLICKRVFHDFEIVF